MYTISACRGPPPFVRNSNRITTNDFVTESPHYNLTYNDFDYASSSTSSTPLSPSPSDMHGKHYQANEYQDEETMPKSKDFWDRKGIIKMDPRNEERCSHTAVPPSTMMKLAMELQVSNRGKAYNMFRQAKLKALDSDESDEEEQRSNLSNLWVISDNDHMSRGNSPSTASHLQPSLANVDFVLKRTAAPDIRNSMLQNEDLSTELELQDEHQALLEKITVAELVGSEDNVVQCYNSESDELVEEEDNEKILKRKDARQPKRNFNDYLCGKISGSEKLVKTGVEFFTGEIVEEKPHSILSEATLLKTADEVTMNAYNTSKIKTVNLPELYQHQNKKISFEDDDDDDFNMKQSQYLVKPEQTKLNIIKGRQEGQNDALMSHEVKAELNIKQTDNCKVLSCTVDSTNDSAVAIESSLPLRDGRTRESAEYFSKATNVKEQNVISETGENNNERLNTCKIIEKYYRDSNSDLPSSLIENLNKEIKEFFKRKAAGSGRKINDKKGKIGDNIIQEKDSKAYESKINKATTKTREEVDQDFVENLAEHAGLEKRIHADSSGSTDPLLVYSTSLSSSLTSLTSIESLSSNSLLSSSSSSSSRSQCDDNVCLNGKIKQEGNMDSINPHENSSANEMTWNCKRRTPRDDAISRCDQKASALSSFGISEACFTAINSTGCITDGKSADENKRIENEADLTFRSTLISPDALTRGGCHNASERSQGNISPPRKVVVCKFSEDSVLKKAKDKSIDGSVTSKAVFQDENDKNKVTTVLYLKKPRYCSDCPLEMALCCCVNRKDKNKGSLRGDNKELARNLQQESGHKKPNKNAILSSKTKSLPEAEIGSNEWRIHSRKGRSNENGKAQTEGSSWANGQAGNCNQPLPVTEHTSVADIYAEEKISSLEKAAVKHENRPVSEEQIVTAAYAVHTKSSAPKESKTYVKVDDDRPKSPTVNSDAIVTNQALNGGCRITLSPKRAADGFKNVHFAETNDINRKEKSHAIGNRDFWNRMENVDDGGNYGLVEKKSIEALRSLSPNVIETKREDVIVSRRAANETLGFFAETHSERGVKVFNRNPNVDVVNGSKITLKKSHEINASGSSVEAKSASHAPSQTPADRHSADKKASKHTEETIITDNVISSYSAPQWLSPTVIVGSLTENTAIKSPNWVHDSATVGSSEPVSTKTRNKSSSVSVDLQRFHDSQESTSSKPSVSSVHDRTKEANVSRAPMQISSSRFAGISKTQTHNLPAETQGKGYIPPLETVVCEPQLVRFESKAFHEVPPPGGAVDWVSPPSTKREAYDVPAKRTFVKSNSAGMKSSNTPSSEGKPPKQIYSSTVFVSIRPTRKKVDYVIKTSSGEDDRISEKIRGAERTEGQYAAPSMQYSSNTHDHRVATPVIQRNAAISVQEMYGCDGRRYENGCYQKQDGTRMITQARMGKMGMESMSNVYPEDDKVFHCHPQAVNNDEEAGVIETPMMKVKEIRAKYKERDYQDYAKPKKLSSSGACSPRKGSDDGMKRRSTLSSHSDGDFDDTKGSDHVVAQQVMNLFKGALDVEKELLAFEQESRQHESNQHELSPSNRNGHVITLNYKTSYEEPLQEPSIHVKQKPGKLNSSSWPPAGKEGKENDVQEIKTTKKNTVEQRNKENEVTSFDESLDQFYDVFNNLTS